LSARSCAPRGLGYEDNHWAFGSLEAVKVAGI
jgi:hypothetical protein